MRGKRKNITHSAKPSHQLEGEIREVKKTLSDLKAEHQVFTDQLFEGLEKGKCRGLSAIRRTQFAIQKEYKAQFSILSSLLVQIEAAREYENRNRRQQEFYELGLQERFKIIPDKRIASICQRIEIEEKIYALRQAVQEITTKSQERINDRPEQN